MENRQPTPGKEGRVKLTRDNGESFFARIEMADDPLNEGTSLSKETLLQDVTASLFGLDNQAVPNDVFSWLGKYNQHWWARTYSGNVDFVQSSYRNAYPDSGNVGDYEYLYLGIPFYNVVTAPKIEIGSYTGTGEAGNSNPNILTFSFEPKFLMVQILGRGVPLGTYAVSSVPMNFGMTVMRGQTRVYTSLPDNANYHGACTLTWNGNSVSWFMNASGTYLDGSEAQLNGLNIDYVYVAIG